jgi:serine/threonine protein kinase
LVRPSSQFSLEEIDKEAEVVSQLCQPGENVNIVHVREHGWLPRNPSYYYIDMECCPQSLEDWIHGGDSKYDRDVPALSFRSHFPGEMEQSTTANSEFGEPGSVAVDGELIADEPANDEEFDLTSIVDIIHDIASGLMYIHERGTVHRDLKPRNGISIKPMTC